MKELLCKTITGVRMTPNAEILCFETTDGLHSFVADGDCCSSSWFNHISGICFLIEGTVNEIEEMPILNAPGTRQDSDLIYGWRIQTEKGTAEIEMRNSSNGYYAGSCSYMGVTDECWNLDYKKKVKIKDISKEIKEDF